MHKGWLACFVILAWTGCASPVITSVDGITDPKQLKKFVLTEGCTINWETPDHLDLRKTAICKITDQATLNDIVWMTNTPEIQILATSRIDDSKLLARIATNEGYHLETRRVAVDKLNDQVALTKIAIGANPEVGGFDCKVVPKKSPIRVAAVEKLTDPDLLKRVAETQRPIQYDASSVKGFGVRLVSINSKGWNPDTDTRRVAIQKISDQEVLSQIALHDENLEIRLLAIQKLTRQDVLVKVILNDRIGTYVESAIQRLTDETLLAEVAIHLKTSNRFKAFDVIFSRLTDQVLLKKICLEVADEVARRRAIEHLTDQPALAQIAIESIDVDLQKIAVDRLTDQDQLVRVVIANPQRFIYYRAFKKVTDPAHLVKVALECPAREVPFDAVGALTSKAALAQVAAQSKEKELRDFALRRMKRLERKSP